MPLMFNLDWNGHIGDAASLMLPDDFYLPIEAPRQRPNAIAFIFVKPRPGVLLAITNVEQAVDLASGVDKGNVESYLRDPIARQALESLYVGPFVSGALKARLPREAL